MTVSPHFDAVDRHQPDIAAFDILGKRGVEKAKIAQVSPAGQFDGFQIGLLEVQSVGDHSFDVVSVSMFGATMKAWAAISKLVPRRLTAWTTSLYKG